MSAAAAGVLYDPARHRPLRAGPWSAARVEGEILDIVRDFESALGPDGCWPSHPLDHADRRPYFAAYAYAYAGAAGAVSDGR